jgi:hypothetical protein
VSELCELVLTSIIMPFEKVNEAHLKSKMSPKPQGRKSGSLEGIQWTHDEIAVKERWTMLQLPRLGLPLA